MEHIKKIIEREKTIILKGADQATKGSFTQVPNFVLKSPNISPGAKLTYAMLLSYAWNNDCSFPGQDKLARHTGLGLRTVKRFIKELADKKFIEVKRRGQGKTNVYVLDFTVGKKI